MRLGGPASNQVGRLALLLAPAGLERGSLVETQGRKDAPDPRATGLAGCAPGLRRRCRRLASRGLAADRAGAPL